MEIEKTPLGGCLLIRSQPYRDPRGMFMEAFHEAALSGRLEGNPRFVQDNVSVSGKGVLRGLHFQRGEHAQAKLVRVLQGRVRDAVVDIRPGSPTFGLHFVTELSAESGTALYIPKGFAHGFLSLADDTVFYYKCDAYYAPGAEGGIRFDDGQLDIDWDFPAAAVRLSEKDRNLPAFKDALV